MKSVNSLPARIAILTIFAIIVILSDGCNNRQCHDQKLPDCEDTAIREFKSAFVECETNNVKQERIHICQDSAAIDMMVKIRSCRGMPSELY